MARSKKFNAKHAEAERQAATASVAKSLRHEAERLRDLGQAQAAAWLEEQADRTEARGRSRQSRRTPILPPKDINSP